LNESAKPNGLADSDRLRDAVTAANVRETKVSASSDYVGGFFYVGDTECWSGIYYAKPQIITFEAYKVNRARAEALGFGRVSDQSKGSFKWTSEIDLDSEEVHFFALSPDSQQAQIQRFITDNTSAVKRMCS
jgi:hypothetical protein